MKTFICRDLSLRGLLISLLLLTLIGPAGARGPSGQDARAERLYRQGMLRLDDGNFRGAITAFQAAYEAKPLARLLYLIGHAHRKLGQPASALRYYEEYRKAATDLSPGFREELDQQIAELRDLAQRTGRLAGPPPPPGSTQDASAGPGPALLLAGSPGQPARRPLYKKWWFWTAIGTGVTVLAIAIGAGVAASRPDPCRDIICR